MSTAATMRVLNVLRHWVSKHAQDFEMDQKLKNLTIEFLEDINYSPNLLPAEHKAASQLLRLITKEESDTNKVDLKKLLTPPSVSNEKSYLSRPICPILRLAKKKRIYMYIIKRILHSVIFIIREK